MNWALWGPSIIAMIGIPLAAIFAWWRERNLKDLQHDRDEAIYRENQNREDRLRREQLEREDRLRSDQQKREDSIRSEQAEREKLLIEERYRDWASQRWWERKAEAYTEIVETLWRMIKYAEASVDYFDVRMEPGFVITEDSTSEEEQKNERRERFYKDSAALRKLVDVGVFVISESTIAILDAYFKRSTEANNMEPVEQAEEYLAATKNCLAGVREAAMIDLRLRP